MKRYLFIAAAILMAFSTYAQNRDRSVNIQAPRLKVGVVLGGGGAKGAAHIGALKYLEEMGIPIDYMAGTSMGSIIGGLYALGYTPDELTHLIAGMDWSQYIGNKIDRASMSYEMRQRNSTFVINLPFSLKSLLDHNSNTTFISQLPSAYVNNSSLINLFNDLCVGYQEQMDFNDLPIPFACVATDMVTGKEVVLRHGSVPTAMRASMAIPGVFSPVPIDTAVLVDGGLVNNFPADVLREMGADIIIGIEITSNKDITADDLQSLPQVFGRLVTNSTSGKREENRALCNIYIVPDVSGYGMLSFTPEAIDTLVGRGYKKASEFNDQLLAIKQAVEASAGHPVSKTLHAPKAKNIAIDSVMLRSITINSATADQNRWLVRKSKLKAGHTYNQEEIENTMDVFRGTGCFDEITYHVKESDSLHQSRLLEGIYDLTVDMKPAKPQVASLGLRYDTEEGAALLLNLGLNAKKFGGSKLDARVKLSFNPRFTVTYTYSQPSLANFSIGYDYRDQHFAAWADKDNKINLHYRQHGASSYVSQFHLLNFSTNIGLSYTRTIFDRASMESTVADSTWFADNRLLTPFIKLEYDNLDDAYFAKQGIAARLTGRYHFDLSTIDSAYSWIKTNCLDIGYSFQAYITPGMGKFTIIPQVYGRWVLNQPMYYNLWNTYGGEIEGRHFENQMPFIGFNTVEATGDNVSIFRVDLRYNFYRKHYLTAMYNALLDWSMLKEGFGIGILETHGAGIKYSYNSAVGPVSLTAHWSGRNMADDFEHHFGAYFSFGYTF